MLKHLQSRSDWNNKNAAEKGFTLIELLVVIIILGILAAVAIFAMGSIQKNADNAACKTEQSIVRTARAAWVAENPSTNVETAATYANIAPYIDGGLASLKQNETVPPSGPIALATDYVCA